MIVAKQLSDTYRRHYRVIMDITETRESYHNRDSLLSGILTITARNILCISCIQTEEAQSQLLLQDPVVLAGAFASYGVDIHPQLQDGYESHMQRLHRDIKVVRQ